MIKIHHDTLIPNQVIEFNTAKPNSVLVGLTEYSNSIGTGDPSTHKIRIIDTNYYLKVIINDKVSIDWNRGDHIVTVFWGGV